MARPSIQSLSAEITALRDQLGTTEQLLAQANAELSKHRKPAKPLVEPIFVAFDHDYARRLSRKVAKVLDRSTYIRPMTAPKGRIVYGVCV